MSNVIEINATYCDTKYINLCARARACVHVCVCVCERERERERERENVHTSGSMCKTASIDI